MADIEHIRHLYVLQRTAASKSARTRARNELNKIITQMQGTANSRLRTLRNSDYAYGTTIDTTEAYLQQTGRKYFTKPTELAHPRRDEAGERYPLSADTYEYALRLAGFLRSKETTVSGQRRIEAKRFQTYRARFEFANDMSDADLRQFLRFMGNSHVGEYLDYFGGTSSEEMEEMASQLMNASEDQYAKVTRLFERFHNYQLAAKAVENGTRAEMPKVGKNYIDFTTLRKELAATYEDINSRRR